MANDEVAAQGRSGDLAGGHGQPHRQCPSIPVRRKNASAPALLAKLDGLVAAVACLRSIPTSETWATVQNEPVPGPRNPS